MTDPSYPIGPAATHLRDRTTPAERAGLMGELDALPERLANAVAGLDDAQLDTPYRKGGWTVRQVVHHVADSHLNGYLRLRWALTEDGPVIKLYEQEEWARLPDASTASVAASLDLLNALHTRWLILLRSMGPEDFERRWTNPDVGERNVDQLLQHYVWHGKHHVAHITALRKREGWQ